MNSALQVLFMNPLFRQIIYDLPLCQGEDINTPSNFVAQGQMYQILIAIQKLFIKLEKYDIRAIITRTLTEAFEWSGPDGTVQHDSQEFIRLIFETLDNILISTSFNGVINNLFRIVNFSFRTCSNCNHTNTSEEYNLEITVPVRDKTGLIDSLDSLYNSSEIISDYKCDECGERVDLKKGSKISQLPVLLNFSLNKMDYDYNTYERIKLTNRFDFPLEIDMRQYVKDVKEGDLEEDFEYELYSIIVHRGTPYQGHYFSYVRDLTSEGNWNLTDLKQFNSEPEKFEEKKEEHVEAIIKDKKSNEVQSETRKNEINHEKKQNSKKNEKKKNNTNTSTKNTSHNRNQGKKNKNETEYEKLNFDQCDHPLTYSNKNLSKQWFDFNDTSITPIRVGRIQKQFQSSESAYILFYMKKSVIVNKTVAPIYLEKCKKFFI